VTSRGFDVNGTSDEFTFAYRTIRGDATIVARVPAFPGADPWSQAGLMIRDGLRGGETHAFVFTTPANGLFLRTRSSRNANTSQVTGGAASSPVWLKLERRGSSVTASRSLDGVNWTGIGTVSVHFSSSVLVGLATASHSKVAGAAATIGNVTINGTAMFDTANVAPTVSLVTPAPAAAFPAPASVSMTATASDPDGTVAKVDFYSGTTLLGSDTTSPYGYTWGNVPAGSYSVKAVATDNKGASTASPTSLITVMAPNVPAVPAPNVPPTVSVMTDKMSYTAPASIAMTAAAADSDGTVARVDFYAGTTLVGWVRSSPFAFAWTGVPAGSYAIKAVATDNSGATTTSTAVNVTVSAPNMAPTVSVNTDKSTYTAPASVAMTAVAADSDGAVVKVDFYAGASLVGSAATAPFAFTWNGAAAGSYPVKAVATDNRGAVTTSAIVTVTVSAPNAAPMVSVTTDKSSYTAPASVVMTAAAADSDGTVTKVDFYAGAALVGSDTTSPFEFTWSGAAVGTYAVKAIATDNSGATTTSTAVNVTVSAPNVAPTVSVNTDKSTYTAPASVAMTAVAADSDGSVVKVDFYAGASLVGSAATAPFAFTWNGAAAGSYPVKAVATDNRGAVTTSAIVTVTVSAPNAAPMVSVTTDKTSYTAPASVVMTAAAADSDGTVTKVDFYAGAALVGSDTTSPFAFTWSGAAVGAYAVKAVATDNSGATTTSTAINITVAAPNVAPTVSLTTPVSGATFTAPASVAIVATAADSDGTVTKVDFYAGATLVGSDSSSPFSFTWNGAAAGSYAVTAVATDNSGATTTSAAVAISIASNVAPTVSMTSPATGASFVSPASVTFTATATDGDGAVQKVEFYVGATLVATDTTSPYSTTWSGAAGSYSVSAAATDNQGAVTMSAWRDFTVTATAVVGTAIFTPAVVPDSVDYYLLEIFAPGADPNLAAPIATQNLGLPPVVGGECAADVRATIVALAPGDYIATVASVSSMEGKLRSPSFSFTR